MQSNAAQLMFPPRLRCKWAAQTLHVSLLLMLACFCHVGAAQNTPKEKLALPYYLSDVEPDSRTANYTKGECSLLDGPHMQSITMQLPFDSKEYELRYSLPPGCTRFTALAGVDNKYPNVNRQFVFTVWVVDAEGTRQKMDFKPAHSGGKPQPFDVDVTGKKQLVLSIITNAPIAFPISTGSLWWSEAKLSGDKIVNPPGSPWQAAGVALAQKLMQQMQAKNLTTKVMGVNRFSLDPEGFDDNAAQQAADGVDSGLKAQSIVPDFKTYPISKNVQVGFDLPEDAHAALQEKVDGRYFLIGKISRRDDKSVVAGTIYNLRDGKVAADAQVSVEKQVSLERPVTSPSSSGRLTLIFTPDSNLHIKTYQWFLDGDGQGDTPVSGTNSRTVDVPSDGKKHKVTLRWSGDGYTYTIQVGPIKQHRIDYRKISAEFEIPDGKDTVELAARVDTTNKKLTLTERVGTEDLPLQWKGL